MKIFVTGASGFIGSYLVKYLCDRSHSVMALKRSTSNLFRLGDYKSQISWVNVDDDNWRDTVIAYNPDAIFNLAWSGVAANERSNFLSQIVNITLQQNLLEIAIRCPNLHTFIGVGSQAEYGIINSVISEDATPNPCSAYGAAKLASLDILKAYCQINNIDWYWFRVFPCFGPTEDDVWLIPSLIKSIYTQPYMDLTKGEQKLAYLYVGEVAKAMASALAVEGHSGIYNISSNCPIKLADLVSKIRNVINEQYVLNFGALPYRDGQSMLMMGSTEKLSSHLYKIDNSYFDIALEDTIRYYMSKYTTYETK